MTRTTRAAQRAQEVEIEIDDDGTHICPQEGGNLDSLNSKAETGRPPLVEMTANAVEDLKLAMDVKQDNIDTIKGKKTKKGTKRGKANARAKDQSPAKSSTDKTESEPSEKDENEEPSTQAETEGTSEVSTVEVEQQIPAIGADFEDQKTTAISEIPQPLDVADSLAKQPEPEAVQKLESLFQQPSEPVPETETVESLVATAAAHPLPPTPSPLQQANTSAQRNTNTKSVKTGAPKPKAKVANDPPSKSSPALASKEKSAGTFRARASLAQTRHPSTVAHARASTIAKSRPSSMVQVSSASPVASKEKKERSAITALHTPPKLVKSNKAPTTSTFQLPSEALKEKFRIQREERQKRQEEQAQKQKENAPKSSIPQKHTTKPRIPSGDQSILASRPRQSISGTIKEASKEKKVEAGAPRPKAATIRPIRRPSTLNHKPVGAGTMRERRPAGGRISSIGLPRAEEPTMTAAQKAEAAKKARADAAEKGRVASREWAERKKRETEAKKVATAQSLADASHGESEIAA